MPSQRSSAAKETTQQSCSRNPHTRRRSDDPASPSRAAHEAATPEGGAKRAAEPLHRSQPSQTNFNRNRALREHNTGARPQYSCKHNSCQRSALVAAWPTRNLISGLLLSLQRRPNKSVYFGVHFELATRTRTYTHAHTHTHKSSGLRVRYLGPLRAFESPRRSSAKILV